MIAIRWMWEGRQECKWHTGHKYKCRLCPHWQYIRHRHDGCHSTTPLTLASTAVLGSMLHREYRSGWLKACCTVKFMQLTVCFWEMSLLKSLNHSLFMAAFHLSFLREELVLPGHCVLLHLSLCFPHLSFLDWQLKGVSPPWNVTGRSSSCGHGRQTGAHLTWQK